MAVLACVVLGVALLVTPLRAEGPAVQLGKQATAATATASATATTASYRPIFTVPASAGYGQDVLPWIDDPDAVDPQAKCPGYKASSVTAKGPGSGFTADLDLAGTACNVFGSDVASLRLTVEYQASDRLHVEIAPRYLGAKNASWFELSEALVPKPSAASASAAAAAAATAKNDDSGQVSDSELTLTWSNTPTFAFTVTRQATGDVIFTTNGTKLVYEDQFIEFVSPLPKNYNLYGLGEVIHGFRLGNNLTRTLFAADAADPIDGNIYGTHPIYLDTRYFDQNGSYVVSVDDNGTSSAAALSAQAFQSYTHGVFLRNAHAQEVLLRPAGITWRTLGGTIDLYFYAGPTAESVIKSYQVSTIGLPAMQQYYTFGFHQCRWGYQNWSVLQEVVDNFKQASIPLETIWTDIDYMNQYRNFDNDQGRFGYAKGAEFLSKLHANGQHYVPIVDSAIYVPNPENASDAYAPFQRGADMDAFMLNGNGSLYIGEVWPGFTVFPDWIGAVLNGTGAFSWWANELAMWHDNVSFDGIWLDMSEVSSFCVGSCGSGNLSLNPVHPPFQLPGEAGGLVVTYPEGFNKTNATQAVSVASVASTQSAGNAKSTSSTAASTSTSYLRTEATEGVRNINYPPYVINNVQGDLAVHAVSPNATHHGGVVEYDTHNLFGHQIINATYQALLSVVPDKRPFIIGRSTFAGTGKWAGHWGGDNESLWAYMVFSIAQALSFSIFGIPMFGVDTCGFNGNSDMELCSRWMQLSAFFPFYRNHNVLGARAQEPYVWAEVAEASRTAMDIRYSLLPYLYTLFAEAHTTGSTVMRALSWEFPGEPWLANADHQFLLGPALLVTPCLEQGATTVKGVFPGVVGGSSSNNSGMGMVWYDWYNQTAVGGSWLRAGQNVTLDAPLGHIPLFVRGGSVLATQAPGMTTAASRKNPWGVLVALDAAGAANGTLYLDDGESVTPNATLWVQLSASQGALAAKPQGAFVDTNALTNVSVMGVAKAPACVSWNGQTLGASQWAYNASRALLQVTQLQNMTAQGAWTKQWTLSWACSGESQ